MYFSSGEVSMGLSELVEGAVSRALEAEGRM